MPDDIVELANQFRNAVLQNERKAAARLVEAYGVIWTRLSKRLAELNQQIKEARAKGEIVNQAWLFRQKRYGDLLRQVDRELRRFTAIAENAITKQQASAAKAGLSDAAALIEAAGVVSFNKLPAAAVENLVGTLGDGSPLKSLLDQLPREARAIVSEGLIEAVALGIGPAATARKIREGLSGNLTRALTISRTETLRAYRTATIQTYQANADVVQGWYWRSARSRRSCSACTALDGKFFPVTRPMRPHPRCRCTLIPAVKGVKVDKGTTWFNKQPADVQRDIIGTDVGYEAFKRGDLKLEDFVGLRRDSRWGETYYQLSVKRAKAGEGQFPE